MEVPNTQLEIGDIVRIKNPGQHGDWQREEEESFCGVIDEVNTSSVRVRDITGEHSLWNPEDLIKENS
ncbi:MAG TPA: hypothetical protein EYO84_06865 [Planctomycetes bacterium]|nr:hypothetical protein [Planctomycetota bacterium]